MSTYNETYIYKWINPNTNKEEILGNLIDYKELNQSGHGGRFQYTFDYSSPISEFKTSICEAFYNKNKLIIQGYIGMGMNYENGMSTIKKVESKDIDINEI